MWILALVLSVALLALRLDLSRVLSLGDAEALYVAYGLHPQPAYLDHPGLIGWIAHIFGPATSPVAIHVGTSLAATALPWWGVLSAVACGAGRSAAVRAYFPLALLPELGLSSSAFSPDLPFVYAWLTALGCAGWALRHPAASFGTLLASLGTGAAAALGCLSKTSGWLLVISLGWVWLSRSQAARWRTIAPWAGLCVFAILTAPLLRWWFTHGLSLRLHESLSWTQASAGLVRPLIAATPPFLFAGALVTRDLLSSHRQAPIDRLLRASLFIPLPLLVLLAAVTHSESGWLMPAYLALSIHVTRTAALPTGLAKSCLAFGSAVVLLGWCWVRTNLPYRAAQLLGGYDPAWDSTTDLYAWGPGRQLLQSVVDGARERTGEVPLVVGPHWTVCAQADLALQGRVPVGCDSVELDDYDHWLNSANWPDSETILFVTDSRFEAPPEMLYGRPSLAVHDVVVSRFGRSVRRISVSEFDREEANARALDWTAKPARSSKASSSTPSGWGVVSSSSP